MSWFWSFCRRSSETVVLFAQGRDICAEENVTWTSKSILWHPSLSSSSLEYSEICFRIKQRFAGLSVMCLCYDPDIRSISFFAVFPFIWGNPGCSFVVFASQTVLCAFRAKIMTISFQNNNVTYISSISFYKANYSAVTAVTLGN